jgi:serine/threonine-protein kinase HipA
MTPLYDVLSMWPYFGDGPNQFRPRKAGLAMAVRSKNAHYLFHTIEARHWLQLAAKHGGDSVWDAMVQLVERVDGALAEVERRLPKDFPARTWECISIGMRSEAMRFLREAAPL